MKQETVSLLKCPDCNREYEKEINLIMSFCPCGKMNEIKIIFEVVNG